MNLDRAVGFGAWDRMFCGSTISKGAIDKFLSVADAPSINGGIDEEISTPSERLSHEKSTLAKEASNLK